MSLLKKLQNEGSRLSNLNGGSAPRPNLKDSKLHFKYSLTGKPSIEGKPNPSMLDLDGEIPSYNYRDNTPEGKSF